MKIHTSQSHGAWQKRTDGANQLSVLDKNSASDMWGSMKEPPMFLTLGVWRVDLHGQDFCQEETLRKTSNTPIIPRHFPTVSPTSRSTSKFKSPEFSKKSHLFFRNHPIFRNPPPPLHDKWTRTPPALEAWKSSVSAPRTERDSQLQCGTGLQACWNRRVCQWSPIWKMLPSPRHPLLASSAGPPIHPKKNG